MLDRHCFGEPDQVIIFMKPELTLKLQGLLQPATTAAAKHSGLENAILSDQSMASKNVRLMPACANKDTRHETPASTKWKGNMSTI